jgi:HPt (histidine-containing phosphotransfer) domain-containing protein
MKRSKSSRPARGKVNREQIRMTPEEKRDLKKLAATTGMTMAQLQRDFLLNPGPIEARLRVEHAARLLNKFRSMREFLSDLPPDHPGATSLMEEFLEVVVQAMVAAGAKLREQLGDQESHREPALGLSQAEREIQQLLTRAEASGLPLAEQLHRELADELRLRRLQ